MSLDNLAKTHQIKPHATHPDEVQRLLAAATRNLADARVEDISDETRFDAAYKAIMQCALVGLMANGYRPSTSMPGHHQTVIQTLSLTLGVPRESWIVMDALRKKRNVNDYSGDLIEPESVRECIAQADALFKHVRQWLSANRQDLLVSV
ncbi:DNA-binding protein [Rhodanobacter ginsengiterrae]|uniref:DNA-binding protein n=1 Tax=Rhodanobacter ginsengiterrae TaxID=2008451 RepID=UPI003CF04AFB